MEDGSQKENTWGGGVGNNDNLESAKHLCGSLAKVTKVCFQVQVPDLLMTTM